MSLSIRPITAVLVVLLLLAPTPYPAAAQESGVPEVLIDGVTPNAPTPKSTLVIRGRVANGGDSPLPRPVIQLRLSPTPLISREEVSAVLDGSSARAGEVLPTTVRQLAEDLPPGQQLPFRLRIPMRELGLPGSAGVYAVIVEALSDGATQAAAGTVFPWFPPGAEYVPSRLALVWPITQRPAVAADRLVVDPRIVAEYPSGGRLERLIRIGQQHPVSWLIDAATVQMSQEMADGYQVLIGDTEQPGDAAPAAASVAARLAAILTAEPDASLPQFAVSDADALTAGGLSAMVVRSASLPLVIRDSTARGAAAAVAYVSPAAATAAALQPLVDAGVRVALVPDTLFPPEPALPYTPSGLTSLDVGGTTLDALLADSRLNAYLSGPFTSADQRSTALQGMLAETAMITLERPAEPRNVVAAPPLLWDPPEAWLARLSRGLAAAPWIRLVGTGTVLAGDGEVPRSTAGAAAGPQSRPLPQRYIGKIRQLQKSLAGLTGIVDQPDGFGESYGLALQRAASSHWRSHPRQRRRLLATIAEQLAAERSRVRVVSSGTVTLAGDSGIVPLTVANDLDRAVTVGVELQPRDGLGVEYQPPQLVSIDATAKAGLEIPVRVPGSRPVTVDVVLTDSSGTEFSRSASIELRSTAATRIAGIIVGIGGVMLAVLVALNFWRRRRSREKAQA